MNFLVSFNSLTFKIFSIPMVMKITLSCVTLNNILDSFIRDLKLRIAKQVSSKPVIIVFVILLQVRVLF